MTPVTFGKSVFRDAGKLSFDYVPDELPGREKELLRLNSIYKLLISGGGAQHTLIRGGVGTGKTAIAKYFCAHFQKDAAEAGKNVGFVEVNCRRRQTDTAVLLKIISHFQPNFPDRGFSPSEMLEILQKHTSKEKVQLIVILDEVDVLLQKKDSNLIYTLTRFEAEAAAQYGYVSIIAISQKNIQPMLDEAALSTFKRTNVIELEKYSQPQLYEILKKRVELAFHQKTVAPEVVELVSEAAAQAGDARFAIELLEKAGMLADEQDAPKVSAEHARRAKAESYSTVNEDRIGQLDVNEKLVLLAIARSLRKRAHTTTGEAEKLYEIACEEYGAQARGHTQFWKYINSLSAQGLINAKKSGEGIAGNTTIISISDIPAENLEENLSNMIKAQTKAGKSP